MGGVDIADQHRAAFKTQRKAMRNWLPHWYWMIDHACINAFKVAVHAPGSDWTKRQHREFRTQLFQEMFRFYWGGEVAGQTSMLGSQRHDLSVLHTYGMLSATGHPCAWCCHEKAIETSRSRTPSPTKRSFSNEIYPNITIGRTKRVRGRYATYKVYLYREK